MRDLAALLAIGIFLTAFYVLAAHGSDAVRIARIDNAVTLTAGR
ncbi:hypothetical protein GCM10011390_50160 [Aureimonas endophytica]|uniref:Uncharacterized protein n=1 Tax=Aureimonas endophytica TaxID=2027858 RepID=A0A917A381_9HYPH|nr:hypothetical protein [Aureimonas endophytica]GGE24682.1 hypothetical protein GCM10011390_50160 [Aureimonas endophytica]